MGRKKIKSSTRRLLKPIVFERDGWRCLVCGSPDNLTLDHVRPIYYSTDNSIENLQALCRTCNELKDSEACDYRRGPHFFGTNQFIVSASLQSIGDVARIIKSKK